MSARMAGDAHNLIWDDGRLRDPHRQPDKAERVRAMFDAIAPTYQRVNCWLSAGRDGSWRRRAVALARMTPEDDVLDVACGTGDFARSFLAAGPRRVVGCDFAEGMLALAARQTPPSTSSSADPGDGRPVRWCRSDALALPFADGSFSVASCAFGVRNFQDLGLGLREIHRILRPGGRAVILEFTLPRGHLSGRAYRFYFRRVLPWAAGLISGDRSGAYRYLPSSVEAFEQAVDLGRALEVAGFSEVRSARLTWGVVTVFVAIKGAATERS